MAKPVEEAAAAAPATAAVVVLDFGAQYNHLIARRIREAEVFCAVLPGDTPWEAIAALRPEAVILSGGPASVFEAGAPAVDPRVLTAGLPVLGICYGMQLMARQLGGTVVPQEGGGEFGRATLRHDAASPLFRGIPSPTPVWMSHGDRVAELPVGFRVLAATERTAVAAMGDPARRLYGVQFHPEVAHTPQGMRLLKNFLFEVAGLRPDWRPGDFVAEAVRALADQIGSRHALVALSGGVDSAVAAALAAQAIGPRLHAILVDHGLLRLREVEEVTAAFPGLDLRVVRAADQFFAALAGVVDPEQKRKIIGREFIRAFEREAERLGRVEVLIQGTVYPDVIESGTRTAHTIKSHHNVGGLPAELGLEVVEPLRWLFKDEVRRVGLQLGLPPALVWRQPFPGPGLAVRMMGAVTAQRAELLRHCDAIVREELAASDDAAARSVWQAFAVLTGTRAVGVKGDRRSYGEVVAIRAVTSEDGMTADWARLPYELLDRMARRLTWEVEGVGRVVYDITSKPPATIEWE